MKLQDNFVFITGARRGLGLEFARQARAPSQRTLPGLILCIDYAR